MEEVVADENVGVTVVANFVDPAGRGSEHKKNQRENPRDKHDEPDVSAPRSPLKTDVATRNLKLYVVPAVKPVTVQATGIEASVSDQTHAALVVCTAPFAVLTTSNTGVMSPFAV